MRTSWAYESGGAAGAIVKSVHGNVERVGLHDCGFGGVGVIDVGERDECLV